MALKRDGGSGEYPVAHDNSSGGGAVYHIVECDGKRFFGFMVHALLCAGAVREKCGNYRYRYRYL